MKLRMSRVIARLFGGLGNQLFIYAAARRLALVNNAELVLDTVSGFTHDKVYGRHYQLDNFNVMCLKATRRDQLEPFGRLRRKFLRQLNLRKPFNRRGYLLQENIDFDQRLLEFKPRGTVYLEGYWQSERYFRDVADIIRQDLTFKPPNDDTNHALAELIRRSLSVAVHVRFFDEPLLSSINNVSSDYYTRAVIEIERRVPGAHYYIFSDQPGAARARIPISDERITLVTNNQGDDAAYADLWLMTQCKHFIIANSTFSWWGAWLASYQNKFVIAPGFEKRNGASWWGFEGLLPDKWIKL